MSDDNCDSDDGFVSDQEKQPSIRSATDGATEAGGNALGKCFGEMRWGNAARFLHYHGQEELSLAISNVNYLLQEIKFQGRKQSKNNELTSTRSIINLKVKCNAQSDFIPYDRYL